MAALIGTTKTTTHTETSSIQVIHWGLGLIKPIRKNDVKPTRNRIFEKNEESEDVDGRPAHDVGQNDEEETEDKVHVVRIGEWRLTPCPTDTHEQSDVRTDHYEYAVPKTIRYYSITI